MERKINITAWIFIGISVALIIIHLSSQIITYEKYKSNDMIFNQEIICSPDTANEIFHLDSLWRNTEFQDH